MDRAYLRVGLALGLAACAARTGTPDATAYLTPGSTCRVPTPTTDSLGREVRAAGFTFCVPVSWRSQGRAASAAVDPRTWRSASGTITWGTGDPPTRDMIATKTVVLREGDPPPQSMPRPDVRNYTESLGGRTAEVTEMHGQNLHLTEARWRDPAVYLHGESRTFATAQLLLAIHRTVRFTLEPSSP